MTVWQKKGLRAPGLRRKYPLTGGAEAHNGTPDGTTEQDFEGPDGKNQRHLRRGAPGSKGRIQSILSLRYLKSMVSEEICGRFGSFDEQTTAHISNYLARASA